MTNDQPQDSWLFWLFFTAFCFALFFGFSSLHSVIAQWLHLAEPTLFKDMGRSILWSGVLLSYVLVFTLCGIWWDKARHRRGRQISREMDFQFDELED